MDGYGMLDLAIILITIAIYELISKYLLFDYDWNYASIYKLIEDTDELNNKQLKIKKQRKQF